MNIYLIRHTSVNVPKGICYGQTDVPLNDTFEEEAKVVKQKLDSISVDTVYSSPLTRCKRLAKYCKEKHDIIYKPELKEMNFGDWEMQKWLEVDYSAWDKDWVNNPVPNGESFKQMYDRVASFFDKLKEKEHNNVAIFTHGGVLACASIYFEGLSPEEAFELKIDYGHILNYQI